MTEATANGQARVADRGELERLLEEPLTQGYTPTLPPWMYDTDTAAPQMYLLRDVERMMVHPIVRNSLTYFKSGTAAVEFDSLADRPEVSEFVLKMAQRFWDRGVPKLQGGYEYGWIAGENLYERDDESGAGPDGKAAGLLEWCDLVQFSPRDVYLLTRNKKPVGVRVKNVFLPEGTGEKDPETGREKAADPVDLWLGTRTVPSKALWYAHEPRYNSFFGQSQLLGAWRPWRRLAGKDGAETVTDSGIYRFAYAGPKVGYPEEQVPVAESAGVPATTVGADGRPRVYARSVARQLAEWAKAGAGIGLPTTKYPPEQGGGDKWTFEFPKSTLNIDGLIAYVKHLWEQISYGVGVPPELLAASEGGSGYSGRKIPREAFLMRCQRIADAMLQLFVEQVLRPLVWWNFGPARFEVKVKNLLMTERKAQTGQEPGAAKQQPALPQQSPTAGRPPGWLEARGIDNVPQPQQGPGSFSIEAARKLVRGVALKILGRAA